MCANTNFNVDLRCNYFPVREQTPGANVKISSAVDKNVRIIRHVVSIDKKSQRLCTLLVIVILYAYYIANRTQPTRTQRARSRECMGKGVYRSTKLTRSIRIHSALRGEMFSAFWLDGWDEVYGWMARDGSDNRFPIKMSPNKPWPMYESRASRRHYNKT